MTVSIMSIQIYLLLGTLGFLHYSHIRRDLGNKMCDWEIEDWAAAFLFMFGGPFYFMLLIGCFASILLMPSVRFLFGFVVRER